MHPQRKEWIFHQLKLAAAEAKPENHPWGAQRTKVLSGEGLTFLLLDDAAAAYDELCRRVFATECWSSKISQRYLDQSFAAILALILNNSSSKTVKEALEQLIRRCEGWCHAQHVYLPIVGLTLERERFDVGKVTLKRISAEYVAEITNTLSSIAPNIPRLPDKFLEAQTQAIADTFNVNAAAEYRTIAEPLRALELAQIETRQALEVLRYAVMVLYPLEHILEGARFGLLGETAFAYGTIPIFCLEEKSFSLSKPVGFQGLNLSADFMNRMELVGANHISELGLVSSGRTHPWSIVPTLATDCSFFLRVF